MLVFTAVFCLVALAGIVNGREPVCSRFHYEEQTLEKMIRLEILVETTKKDIVSTEMKVLKALDDLHTSQNKLMVDVEKKIAEIDPLKENIYEELDRIKHETKENILNSSAEFEKLRGSMVVPFFAFTAEQVEDNSLADGKTIAFTENILNIGDVYDNKTGIFLSPVNGIYHFTAIICMSAGKVSYVGISVGGRVMSQILAGDNSYYQCNSLDTVAAVDKGGQVFVKCIGSCSGDTLWESRGYVTNSFSGMLLHVLPK